MINAKFKKLTKKEKDQESEREKRSKSGLLSSAGLV